MKTTIPTKTQVVYSHKELALLYFPGSQAKTASAQLTEWILRDKALFEELQLAGYVRGQRLFTPLQVSLLFYYLGAPEPIDWTAGPQRPDRSAKPSTKR